MSYNPNNPNGQATSASSAPVVVASDQSNLPVNNKQLNGVAISVGNGVTDTGTQRVSLSSDSTGQVKLAAGAAAIGSLTAGTAIVGKVGIDQTTNGTTNAVNIVSRAAGGAAAFTLISAATTNATSVKASAGTIYGIQASNTGTGVAFLKIYNKATAPTVGTDTAVKTLIIPAGGGIVVNYNDIGVALGTGIAIAITGVATTADTTAVALAQVVANIDYF